ncbi:hypothetical protein PR048_030491 [Dryococelus australis]|uniref:Integrase n=1 Tax=Dryococelus australis TaxID=614101 RepID=A0ABQ9G947_9NEOP|nr:hypothetical protein PR048_030491 [Dryococelus australis]
MNQHIENFVKICSSCQTHQVSRPKEHFMSHEIPNLLFYKMGINIVEVQVTLKCLFSLHGLPTIIVSDNVPFSREIFWTFAKEFDIELIFISPQHP